MALDIAMGGSTNTILHLLAAAQEAERRLRPGRHRRDLAPGALPVQGRARTRRDSTTWRTCTGPAASPPSSASSTAAGLLTATSTPSTPASLGDWLDDWDVRGGSPSAEARRAVARGARLRPLRRAASRSPSAGTTLDTDAADGCIRDVEHAYSTDGGLAVLYGNLAVDGCVVKTAGVDESIWTFEGPAVVCESQEEAVEKILEQAGQGGRRGRHPLRGPQGRPRHAGDALPDLLPQGPRAWARPARWSPTAASPAARRACPSATSPPRRPPAAPSRWSRTATASASTSPAASSSCWSPRTSWPPAASACWPTWAATGRATASARCPPRCRPTPRWPRRPPRARRATCRSCLADRRYDPVRQAMTVSPAVQVFEKCRWSSRIIGVWLQS